MRRTFFWLLIAVCTFALGFGAAMMWLQPQRLAVPEMIPPPSPAYDVRLFLEADADMAGASKLPILNYCELAGNPERYSGKTVRVRANLRGFIHGMFISDELCLEANGQAAATYDPDRTDEITRVLNEARGSTSPGNWLQPVEIIAVGKFEKVTPSHESDTIYDTAPLQFEIIRVEKALKSR